MPSEAPTSLRPQNVDGMPVVTCEEIYEQKANIANKRLRLIDVRQFDEFNGELGHVAGAELVPLGTELTRLLTNGDRNQEIAFICRSGGRSGAATAESRKLGYSRTANVAGGMIRWNEIKLPIVRND